MLFVSKTKTDYTESQMLERLRCHLNRARVIETPGIVHLVIPRGRRMHGVQELVLLVNRGKPVDVRFFKWWEFYKLGVKYRNKR